MTIHEYNRCVDSFSDGIYRFILKNLRNEPHAKDVVQDSFERLWLCHSEIEFEKAKSFLFTVAYHRMIDGIRKDSKLVDLEQMKKNDYSYEQSNSNLKEVLDLAITKLPEIQRSVVLLRDYEGYSYKEIADITNLSETQVKVYIYRARLFLKEYIGCLENVI